jgi:hypothetical protein
MDTVKNGECEVETKNNKINGYIYTKDNSTIYVGNNGFIVGGRPN